MVPQSDRHRLDAERQARLHFVLALLEKHRALETWTHNQSVRQREVLEALVHRQNLAELELRLRGLAPGDLAYILQTLSSADRRLVWQHLGETEAMEVLPEVDRAVRDELVAQTPAATIAAFLARMDPDDFAYVSESMPAELVEKARTAREQVDAESSAAHPEASVGRLMSDDYVSARDTSTVGAAIEQIRGRRRLPRHIDALHVVDGRNVLRGLVPLRDLLVLAPETPIHTLAVVPPVTFLPTDRADVAAEAFARHDLFSAPIVDRRGKLLGVLPVDAVMDVARARATRDIQMLGGLEALDAPYSDVPFWAMVRKRGGWLSALFFGEMLTATAMSHYEEEVARAVVLALFIPLIISSGGNSGSQAASLIIRALALQELKGRDWHRVLGRELLSGLTLGMALGAIGFTRIVLWHALHLTDYGPQYMSVAVTVWLSLIGVVCFGTLAGSMLPFLLHRLGFDPATSSAPFVATLVDVTGLMIYFQVASMILRGPA